MLIEKAEIPPQIELKLTSHGFLGIFARYDFAAGTDIYSHSSRPLPEHTKIQLDTPAGPVLIDMKLHGVKRADGLRDYFGFDSFMNHSCDPTTFSVVLPEHAGTGGYITRAARAIRAGDEITCNYLLFDWDCDGHAFDCLCEAKNCFGRIAGFSGLPFETQLNLVDELDDPILQRFVAAAGDRLRTASLSATAVARIKALGSAAANPSEAAT